MHALNVMQFTRSSKGCGAGSANGCVTCFGICLSRGKDATRAAELAEYAAETTGRFWEVHEALMERGPAFSGRRLRADRTGTSTYR